MKTWKRNAIVAAVLVFVCTGIYLNWRYEEKKTPDLVSTLDKEKIMNDATLVLSGEGDSLEVLASENAAANLQAEYFAKMRLSRQESRDSAVHLLQETISYAGEDEDVSSSTDQLQSIVTMALSEASVESLVISKGFSDCVAYMTDEGITLAVAAGENRLSDEDVALLTDIVLSQTQYELPQIRIIEVNR